MALISYFDKPTAQFQFRHSEAVDAERRQTRPELRNNTFGVEVEVDDGDGRNALVAALDELHLPIYEKTDGSLHANGVEIITHPGSLAWHMYEMRWAEVFRLCRKNGYDSDGTTTCGLHIHVGRAALGQTEQVRRTMAAKLVLIVNAVWESLVTFTRRRLSELRDWAPRPLAGALERVDLMDNAQLRALALHAGGQDGPHQARYTAVNLTNDNTVEFRIFKGTLKRTTLLASMQLVDCMIRYAATHTLKECATVAWGDLLALSSFKELDAYCEARGLA